MSKNIGEDSLHGGTHGWSMKVWNATIENDCVVMTLISPDGDEGYPGTVTATATFQLSDNGELRIKMKATSSKATPINLTNHSYFNLAGHVCNIFLATQHEKQEQLSSHYHISINTISKKIRWIFLCIANGYNG